MTTRNWLKNTVVAAFAGVVILAVTGACGGDDDCATGTKICLNDDTTCTCAPSCGSRDDCLKNVICHGTACTPCGGPAGADKCICNESLCVPAKWDVGETITFKK
jgi:hypothetical protein